MKDLSWIPFNKAIELADKNDNESEIERRKVTNINEEVYNSIYYLDASLGGEW